MTLSFFFTDQDTKTATLDATAKVGDDDVPIPGLETDLCKKGLSCPLKKGTSYTLNYPVTVDKSLPSVS